MRRILIIENDENLSSSYTQILKQGGFDVIVASNGDIGINEAIKKIPDLILCNTSLPNINGFNVLSVLSKNALTAHIPFVFVSSTTKFSNLRKGMNMGADDFIVHPLRNNQLLAAVEARFNKSKLRVEVNKSPEDTPDDILIEEKIIEQLQETLLPSNIRQLKKKQTLYYEGDYSLGIYFLKKGSIKTFKLNGDGRQLITNIYHSNSIIGLGYLMMDGPLCENAETIEASSVYFISKKAILDLLKVDIKLNHYIIRLLSNDLVSKKGRLVELAYESVRKRLSKVIIQLNKDSLSVDVIEISRDELAGLAGVASETVSRILTDFKQLGLIERNGNLIHITNHEGLVKGSN